MFSDEKHFDSDGVYSCENDRIWAPDCETADKNGVVYCRAKYLLGVMIWLGVGYADVTCPVIIEKGTIYHQIYIKEILLITLKDGQKLMDKQFMYQQDGAYAYTRMV